MQAFTLLWPIRGLRGALPSCPRISFAPVRPSPTALPLLRSAARYQSAPPSPATERGEFEKHRSISFDLRSMHHLVVTKRYEEATQAAINQLLCAPSSRATRKSCTFLIAYFASGDFDGDITLIKEFVRAILSTRVLLPPSSLISAFATIAKRGSYDDVYELYLLIPPDSTILSSIFVTLLQAATIEKNYGEFSRLCSFIKSKKHLHSGPGYTELVVDQAKLRFVLTNLLAHGAYNHVVELLEALKLDSMSDFGEFNQHIYLFSLVELNRNEKVRELWRSLPLKRRTSLSSRSITSIIRALKDLNDMSAIRELHDALGSELFTLQREQVLPFLIEAYTALKDFESAENLFKKAQEVSEKLPTRVYLAHLKTLVAARRVGEAADLAKSALLTGVSHKEIQNILNGNLLRCALSYFLFYNSRNKTNSSKRPRDVAGHIGAPKEGDHDEVVYQQFLKLASEKNFSDLSQELFDRLSANSSSRPRFLFNCWFKAAIYAQPARLTVAYDVFEKALRRNVLISISFLAHFIRYCSAPNDLILIPRVFEALNRGRGFYAPPALLRVATAVLCEHNRFKLAYSLFQSEVQRGITIDSRIVTSLVSLAYKQQQCDDIGRIIHLALEKGVELAPHLISKWLAAACQLSDQQAPKNVFNMLQRHNYAFSIDFFNDAVLTSSRCKRLDLVDYFKDKLLNLYSPRELALNTWTILMESYSRLSRFDESLNIYKLMRESKVQPDYIFFERLIKSAGYARREDVVAEIVTDARLNYSIDLSAVKVQAVRKLQVDTASKTAQ